MPLALFVLYMLDEEADVQPVAVLKSINANNSDPPMKDRAAIRGTTLSIGGRCFESPIELLVEGNVGHAID